MNFSDLVFWQQPEIKHNNSLPVNFSICCLHSPTNCAHVTLLDYFYKTEADADKDYEARIYQETVRCDMQTLGKIWRHKKKKLVMQQAQWYVYVLVTHSEIHRVHQNEDIN